MKKSETIEKIAQLSGVELTDCDKVLKALEQVLNEELKSSSGLKNAFGKIYRLLSFFENK